MKIRSQKLENKTPNRIVNMDISLDNMNVEYHNIESNVKFMLEVNNMTKWRLWPDKTYIHWGSISSPPTFILSGEKGAISGHNTVGDYDGHYATGATGVVSWKIGDTGKKLAIMYTLPYRFEKLKNKMSIAIVDESQKINKKFLMRHKQADQQLLKQGLTSFIYHYLHLSG